VTTATAPAEDESPAALPWARRLVTSTWGAAIVLLGAYLVLSLLMDPMGSLGTDTGGKVATLEVMTSDGISVDPDVGYWAAEVDPDGAHHGLWYTSLVGDRYVNVTTLPMIEIAAPLYRVGGYRAALLLPIGGAIAAAFAARALARLAEADDRRAWIAYWAVGLASPLTIYALDLWEHTLGVALVAWGLVALLHVRGWRSALVGGVVAGLAFGAAFSMRTEALVYGFVAVAVCCVTSGLRGRWAAMLATGTGAAAGVAAAVGANLLLESAVLGESFRAGRASATAGGGGSDLAMRLEEALITAAGLLPSADPADIALGVALAVALVVAARASTDSTHRRLALGAGAVAAALYLFRVLEGPGFVPGLVAAAPLAAVGLAFVPVGWAGRQIAAVALISLPLVWYFQYAGGAVPQWAGRYILPSAVLLVVLGVVASDRMPGAAFRAFLVAAVVVTGFGLVWMSERTHEIGQAARDVEAFPEPVLVSSENFFLRELGAVYDGRSTKWLSARDASEADGAVALLAGGADNRFAYLTRATGAKEFDGFRAVGERSYDWLGVPWRVVTYERSSSP
jgi:hypothetical protein